MYLFPDRTFPGCSLTSARKSPGILEIRPVYLFPAGTFPGSSLTPARNASGSFVYLFPTRTFPGLICLVTCSHTGVFRDSSLPQPRIIIANSCDVPVPRPEYFGMFPFPLLELLQFYGCISADQKKQINMLYLSTGHFSK